MKLGQRAMATLHYSLSKCEHFYLFFSYPTPSFLLLALILLGPGEATRSELFGTERVAVASPHHSPELYINVLTCERVYLVCNTFSTTGSQ